MKERLRYNHVTALAFLKKGYQILPLSKKTGYPIIKYKGIEITEEILKSVDWDECDYGLLMRGVWGIDIDTHNISPELGHDIKVMFELMGVGLFDVLKTDHFNRGLDGYSSILSHELKGELVRNFKNTYVELTKSGGMHILFKKQDGIDYSQKIGLIDGVDIKANDNNYIKIYPSDGRDILQRVDQLAIYDGDFDKKIFETPKQMIVTNYFSGSLVKPKTTSHEGSQAYERVSRGDSINRNDDLFKAACWAFENNHDIEPLTAIVGTLKGRDVFTEDEFDRTIESAKRTVNKL